VILVNCRTTIYHNSSFIMKDVFQRTVLVHKVTNIIQVFMSDDQKKKVVDLLSAFLLKASLKQQLR
jgi:hypothetical protein